MAFGTDQSHCGPAIAIPGQGTMWQRLRMIAACTCIILCIGSAFLWAVSYSVNYEIVNNVEQWKYYWVGSWKGKIQIGQFGGNKSRRIGKWVLWGISDEGMYGKYATYSKGWEENAFRVSWTEHDKSLAAPYWFLVIMTGASAAVLKPKPRLKFGISDMLLLTTVAAVLMALIATLAKCFR